MRPLIFDIQRFSIHDGPGIRTVVFFKGCNLECPWCQNPESIALYQELAYYPEKCTGNQDCVKSCTHHAISYQNGIQINRDTCKECDECVVQCQAGALKIIGKIYTAEAVMEEILKDYDYYASSGGGVTFSGGEPTLHIKFLRELLLLCKQHGLHTNIETNGYFSWEKFETILPLLDLIYFDIKIADAHDHKKYLSAGNDKILHNIEKLIEANAPVEFRIPLIPEYTATPDNLKDILSLLKDNKITKIHLLPYHNMGENKAEKTGSSLRKLGFSPFCTEEIQSFKEYFEKEQIETLLYR
ncbi:MAG: glycyl-radical enzyme activating protein [Chitinophagales bacterium]